MTIHARRLPTRLQQTYAHIRVQAGQACDVTYEIFDSASQSPVDWSGQDSRFRVYSQVVDRSVVMEITDPERCTLGPDGNWRLQLSASETERLPRGGMTFTLEHRNSNSDYLPGLKGGISCFDPNSASPQRVDPASTRQQPISRSRLRRNLVGESSY
ncbi:hypothetical protein [Rubripirellula reticaptiva]|uniref:Uncharacterized protein n=1 Tax=Rubripirellula reticaptiva TaxID=2528013 RepID=A0A5C6F8M1_9BACT|nr:hypothetical protein [Rubripirellula reticaptiva]TWU57645.1 hypothetical protein Poly59_05520 [Rubripirellula reticaptiva]